MKTKPQIEFMLREIAGRLTIFSRQTGAVNWNTAGFIELGADPGLIGEFYAAARAKRIKFL